MLFFLWCVGLPSKRRFDIDGHELIALPLTIGIARWENNISDQKARSALNWARGSMAYAGGPYLLISHVPWLNVLAIWFVAYQVALFYRLSGTGDIELGDTWVETSSEESCGMIGMVIVGLAQKQLANFHSKQNLSWPMEHLLG